jgi:hypothetical protein
MYSCIYFFIIFCMHLNIQTLWDPQPTLHFYDILLQILFQEIEIGHL